MPYYYHLRRRVRNKEERKRVIDKLVTLRKRLDRALPPKDADQNLLLATWNIRDFDKNCRPWAAQIEDPDDAGDE